MVKSVDYTLVKNAATEKAIKTLREVGGFAVLDNWSIIEIAGADAEQFLQARVTSDVKALKSGDGQKSALLDRKAHLVAFFSLYLLDEKYWIICSQNQCATIIKELGTYLFAEKLTITDLTAENIFWTVQGAYSEYLLSELTNCLSEAKQIGQTTIDGQSTTWIRQSLTGELGFLLILNKSGKPAILQLEKQAGNLGMVQLSTDALDIASIEAGMPRFAIDVGPDNILPETSLDTACVSYTKGCYLGQEVIARVKAQGAPRRGLMGLVFAPGIAQNFTLNSDVLLDGKLIGQIKSNVYSPTLDRTIALTLINREYRVPDIELVVEISGASYKVTVITLPFFTAQDNNQKAQSIYESSLSLYTKGNEEEAIKLLRQAIKLHRLHGDSYEMLGVMLGKRGQLDEAIGLMKKLEQIDPESVMAHANLSVFYVQQGNKDKAEEEKAIAMSLRMQQASRELSQQKEEQGEKKRREEEALRRLEMFKQVIAIDAEDLLANFGLGNLYVELEKYEQAIPLLKKAIEVKPDYTAAFLALGLALQGNKQYPEAMDIYRQGIACASRRGDGEPMTKMKEKLTALESSQISTGAN